MLKRIDFKALVGFIASASIGMFTITGHVQKVIHFADPINEMFFASLSFVMAMGCLAAIKK
jgi:hypothetical protein